MYLQQCLLQCSILCSSIIHVICCCELHVNFVQADCVMYYCFQYICLRLTMHSNISFVKLVFQPSHDCTSHSHCHVYVTTNNACSYAPCYFPALLMLFAAVYLLHINYVQAYFVMYYCPHYICLRLILNSNITLLSYLFNDHMFVLLTATGMFLYVL